MKKNVLLLLMIVFITGPIYAQKQPTNESLNPKDAEKSIKKGDRFFNGGFIKQALESYLEAYAFDSTSEKIDYKLGVCYYIQNYPKKSIRFLNKAYAANEKVADDIHFLLARNYHLSCQFDKATEEYKLHKEKMGQNADPRLDKYIEECFNGSKMYKDSSRFAIRNFGPAINTNDPEYSLFKFPGDSILLFTSKRSTSLGNIKNPLTNQYYEDIFVCRKRNNVWQPSENMGNVLNMKGNNAGVSLSPDGKTMFLFMDKKGGDIYQSNLVDGYWSDPKAIPSPINTSASESSVSISGDGKTLYFVSNREKGSLGGKDIFYATKAENGKWNDPINIGSDINTKYDEEGVYVYPTGDSLFFSSKGHNSMGGFDVFKCVKEKNGNWSKPINLGYPINSPEDDVFYTVYDSTKAYLTSIREDGKTESDIYIAYFVPPLTAADSAALLVKKDTMVVVDNQDVINKNDKNITDNNSKGAPKNCTALDEFKKTSIGNFVVVQNILFAINQSENTSAYPNLDKLANYLKSNSGALINIVGYTDLQGDRDYNVKLSQRRADFVKNYLVTKGVPANSFAIMASGPDKPISVNKKDDGTFNKEGIKYNRRVEFEVKKQGSSALLFVEQIPVPDAVKLNKETSKTVYSIFLMSSKSDTETQFKNMSDVKVKKLDDCDYIYYKGLYKNLSDAQKAYSELIKNAFTEAFIFENSFDK